MDSVDKSDRSVDKSDKDGREDRKPAEKPISLHPLKFEEAVQGLLRADRKGNKITPIKTGSETGDGKRT